MDTYKATNTLNGKFYIGSATSFEKRKREHLKSQRNFPFQNALRQNPDAFEWEVWSDNGDERILEQALLDMWFGCEQCYNLSSKATGWGPEHVKRGVENPNYGKPGTNLGKTWWVKDEIEMMSYLCPGEGWEPGRNREHAKKVSATLKGAHKGEKHPMSKLTDKEREEIKERAILGFGGNVQQLAEKYGVNGRTIRGIANPPLR
jgi:hypothetical protein